MIQKYVIKSSGEQELFSVEKFQRSLRKAGAKQEQIEQLTQKVLADPLLQTTYDIYRYAYEQLLKQAPPVAARYNLKMALSELGPTGYPFEHFVATIFKEQGFETAIDQTLPGFCVTHEIDIILKKDSKHYMVECKFHAIHLKANVKIPLYIKARFDDVLKVLHHQESVAEFHQAWVVTNTQFTSEAIIYGECVGLNMISWSYPKDRGLAYMIDAYGIHPITTLTSLTRKQKQALIKEGLVLCKDAAASRHLLEKIGLHKKKIDQVLYEAQVVCELGAID